MKKKPTGCPDKTEYDLRVFLKKEKLENIAIKHSNISYEEFLNFQAIIKQRSVKIALREHKVMEKVVK